MIMHVATLYKTVTSLGELWCDDLNSILEWLHYGKSISLSDTGNALFKDAIDIFPQP